MTDSLSVNQISTFLRSYADRIDQGQQALSELDSATGDADHGANMRRGMRAVVALLDGAKGFSTPGDLFKSVGFAIVGTVGGSSGALYGTIFLRLAAAAGEGNETLDTETLGMGLQAAAQGVVDRGGARLGDKTMYDAIKPAADVFVARAAAGASIQDALSAAAKAAEDGARSTRDMRARRGKSSYVGEDSIGTVDPGAESVAWMLRSLAQATLT
ncbi:MULTISPECIES: dihydroxyacetone kinase subunit DhaL [Mameliella]|uniref:Dihydroxyacetone kinase subunit DhaL n=1 Tax=Mameliella alba TaxID=561184 RepID=A0A0B3S0L6_9RHOB|nr:MULTISPECIES: dihydroxyacetone kinase subunit DhaL [Mameliella]KHQ50121.1 Dihydroxyacetone kinase subunit DhaL [Mameliella alba]